MGRRSLASMIEEAYFKMIDDASEHDYIVEKLDEVILNTHPEVKHTGLQKMGKIYSNKIIDIKILGQKYKHKEINFYKYKQIINQKIDEQKSLEREQMEKMGKDNYKTGLLKNFAFAHKNLIYNFYFNVTEDDITVTHIRYIDMWNEDMKKQALYHYYDNNVNILSSVYDRDKFVKVIYKELNKIAEESTNKKSKYKFTWDIRK